MIGIIGNIVKILKKNRTDRNVDFTGKKIGRIIEKSGS